MPYLSKLVINDAFPAAIAELQNPYALHRSLSRAFDDNPNVYRAARVLYALGPSRVGVLVQSRFLPDWSLLLGSFFLLQPAEVTRFDPVFAPGEVLEFRLRANPTWKRDGSRQPVAPADCPQWLDGKGVRHGFSAGPVRVTLEPPFLLRHPDQPPASLHSVLFRGRLTVHDPAALAQAVCSGIGSAKAFGFGLLSLARTE